MTMCYYFSLMFLHTLLKWQLDTLSEINSPLSWCTLIMPLKLLKGQYKDVDHLVSSMKKAFMKVSIKIKTSWTTSNFANTSSVSCNSMQFVVRDCHTTQNLQWTEESIDFLNAEDAASIVIGTGIFL